jgi:hypothetical protein
MRTFDDELEDAPTELVELTNDGTTEEA